MATHSSILAWRIPWTEEPGGLQQGVSKESEMTEATLAHMYTGILSLQLKEAKGEGEKKSFPKFPVSISNPQGSFSNTTQKR